MKNNSLNTTVVFDDVLINCMYVKYPNAPNWIKRRFMPEV